MGVISNFVILFKAPKEEDNEPFQAALVSESFKVNIVHTLEFSYVNGCLLKEKLSHPEEYTGIILTSPRCVEAMAFALGDETLDPIWRDRRNYCVGHSTFECAKKYFDIVCDGKDTGNSEELSNFIIQANISLTKPFLIPQSSIRTCSLSSKLALYKMPFEEVTSYETIPCADLKKQLLEKTSNFKESPKYLVFFSPSGVKTAAETLRSIQDIQNIKIIAIGPTTKKALEAENFKVNGICQKPTPEHLVAVIKGLNTL